MSSCVITCISDSSGTLQAANYPSLGSAAPYSPVTNTQNGTAYTFATDTSYALGVASPITSSVQEPITSRQQNQLLMNFVN